MSVCRPSVFDPILDCVQEIASRPSVTTPNCRTSLNPIWWTRISRWQCWITARALTVRFNSFLPSFLLAFFYSSIEFGCVFAFFIDHHIPFRWNFRRLLLGFIRFFVCPSAGLLALVSRFSTHFSTYFSPMSALSIISLSLSCHDRL